MIALRIIPRNHCYVAFATKHAEDVVKNRLLVLLGRQVLPEL